MHFNFFFTSYFSVCVLNNELVAITVVKASKFRWTAIHVEQVKEDYWTRRILWRNLSIKEKTKEYAKKKSRWLNDFDTDLIIL